ncbi:zinc finger protein 319-like [Bacillus rossius redtenbacheri]|uniref:zinc finger protein 319-like n=1 Tax=Bacillus rossius redtenbacheri TaxID=93214 RepID=UPI002FDECE3E
MIVFELRCDSFRFYNSSSLAFSASPCVELLPSVIRLENACLPSGVPCGSATFPVPVCCTTFRSSSCVRAVHSESFLFSSELIMKRTSTGVPVAAGQPSTSGVCQPASGAIQPSTSGAAQVCAPTPPGNGCAFCSKVFTASHSARRHEKVCAANPGRTVNNQCHTCGMTLSRKDSLTRHMRTCAGTTEHSSGSRCKFCGQVFEHSRHARRHEQSQCHFNPERITFTCTTCQGEFTRKDTLFVHNKTCKGLAPKRRCVDATSGLQQPGPSTHPQYVASVPDQARVDLEAQAPDQAQVDLEAGGTGFVEAETAFRRNLKTYVAENNGTTKDIYTYMAQMKNNLMNQITNEVNENGPVKFNIWLECDYAKPAPFDEGVEESIQDKKYSHI